MKAMSKMDHDRFSDAIGRIDAANGADPETEEVEGRSWPKALLYGLRMSACLDERAPARRKPCGLPCDVSIFKDGKYPAAIFPSAVWATGSGGRNWPGTTRRPRETYCGTSDMTMPWWTACSPS